MFALAPGAAQAAETGVVPDITWGIDDQDQDRTATELQAVGAQWVRAGISWSDWVEPSKGSYSSSALSHFDRGIDLAIASGYRVMVMVEESPSWAHEGSNKNSPPRDNADLATFMAFLANRYEGKVEAYQVWNEPNLEWAWPSGPNPGQYAQMLRAVAPAIRAADPSAKVTFAGISRNDYQYLEGVYAAMPDIGHYFDVMATHPYVFYGRPPESVWLDENGRVAKGTFSGYRELRRTMENHGDIKPIWLTEFGWSTTTDTSVPHNTGVSPETQAAYLARAYDCLAQDPYVEVALWYNFRNESWMNDVDTWVTQLGLMTTDFTRKPAFYALKNYRPGTGGCRYDDQPATDQPATDPPAIDPPSVAELIPTVPAQAVAPSPDTTPASSGPLTGIWTGASDDAASYAQSPRLAVQRAVIRDGRLVIDGRLARGATGTLRSVAAYGDMKHHFSTRVTGAGKIRVRKRLPGGADARLAWVGLVYGRNARFHGQWVILQAAPRSARLRMSPEAQTTTLAQSYPVRGTVAPDAHGSVALALAYRTANGTARFVTRRSRIRSGEFRCTLRLPAGARDPILYAVFPGDPAREIGGSSRTLALPSN